MAGGAITLLRLARGQSTADIQIRPSWLWIWLCAMVVFTVLRNLSGVRVVSTIKVALES